MKSKLLLLLSFAFTCLSSNAEQTENAIAFEQDQPMSVDTVAKKKIQFDYHLAAVAGAGVANWLTENDVIGKRYTANFYAGALLDFQFTDGWQAETGLTLQHKGYRKENTGYTEYEKKHIRLLYLEIPLYAGYEIPISQIHLTPQIGPYLAFAVMGKDVGFTTNTAKDNDGNEIYVRKWSDHNMFEESEHNGRKKYRRFDCGLHFGASVRIFDNIRLGLGYEFGFVNVQRKDYSKKAKKTKNSDFSFHVAYYFF